MLSEAAKKLKPLHIGPNGAIIKDSRDTAWLRAGYDRAVQKGELSALTSFNHYRRVAEQIERELVDLTTSDGVTVAGYKTHFIDRLIGSYHEEREPVSIEDVKNALLSQNVVYRRPYDSQPSNKYATDSCYVSVNPESGILIQTTPRKKGR